MRKPKNYLWKAISSSKIYLRTCVRDSILKGFKRSILINKKGVKELIGLLLRFLAQEE
jgi:hypothetical protein